jgi:hypothetical protein
MEAAEDFLHGLPHSRSVTKLAQADLPSCVDTVP